MLFVALAVAVVIVPCVPACAQALAGEVPRRLIAIGNVCAWPNLVKMKDGTLLAGRGGRAMVGCYNGFPPRRAL